MQNIKEKRQLCALVCAGVIGDKTAPSISSSPLSTLISPTIGAAIPINQITPPVTPSTDPPSIPIEEPVTDPNKVPPSEPPPSEVPPIGPQKQPSTPPMGAALFDSSRAMLVTTELRLIFSFSESE